MNPRSDWSEVAIGFTATFWACWLAFVLSALLFGCTPQCRSQCQGANCGTFCRTTIARW